jgi:hypothetical protein
MSGTIDPQPVPGSRLRVLAENLFDRATFERYIAPAIADLQFECGAEGPSVGVRHPLRKRCQAYWAVMRTMAFCLVGRGSSGATHGILVRAGAIFVLLTTAMLWLSFSDRGVFDRVSPAEGLLLLGLLLPSAAAVTLPLTVLACGSLRSIWRPRGDRASRCPADVARSIVGLSVIAAAINLILVNFLVPVANQSYREQIYNHLSASSTWVSVPKGDNERTFSEVWTVDDRTRARLALHQRFAIPAAAIVFGLLTFSVGWRLYRRSRPMLMAPGIFGAAFIAYFFAWQGGRYLALSLRVPAWLGAWAPNILIAAFALLVLHRTVVQLADDPAAGDQMPGDGQSGAGAARS